MNNPLLIGVCGRRGAGKDTACDFITEWGEEGRNLSVVRHGFADKLKHSAMTALGFVVQETDGVVLANSLKELGEITTYIPNQSVAYTISGRKFLQLYGTEAHRDIFGKDFWIDALLPIHYKENGDIESFDWHSNFNHADICLVPDVRFDNEAARIKRLGGYIWKIDRPGGEQDGHASEAGISPELIDNTVPNDRDLDWFQMQVRTEMTIEFHMRFVEPQQEESAS